MQRSQLLQGGQKSQNSNIALRAPRIWLVSLITFVISSLLVSTTLALLLAVSPALFAALFAEIFGGSVIVPLLFFFLVLFFLLFTNRAYTIKTYRKALSKHLATSMNSYY